MSKISNTSAYGNIVPAAADYLVLTDADNYLATKTCTALSIAMLDPDNTLAEVLAAGNTATNNINLTGNITLVGVQTISSTLSVSGAVSFASQLTVTGATLLNNTLGVASAATFTGSATFNGAVVTNSTLELNSTLLDDLGNSGTSGQILSSTFSGIRWVDQVAAGLSYQGTWDARTQAEGGAAGDGGNPDLLLATVAAGYYYIVNVAGSVDLDGETDWKIGDWAVYSDSGVWQKVDNTSILAGSGTASTIPMWIGSTTLGNSPITRVSGAGYIYTDIGNVILAGTTASGFTNCVSLNESNINSANYSLATGKSTTASALHATAMGLSSTASGAESFAAGNTVLASGPQSVAFGKDTIASGTSATALGYNNTASGIYSFTVGSNNTASGDHTHAIGTSNLASSAYAIAIGQTNQATALNALAIGRQSVASGANSLSFGYLSAASGIGAISLGTSSTASGDYSFAVGDSSVSGQNYSVALGLGTTSSSMYQTVIGKYNSSSSVTGELFSIGVGSSDASRLTGLRFINTGGVSSLTVTGDIRATGKLLDSSGASGTAGQLLSSTGTTTAWINDNVGSVSGSGNGDILAMWTGSGASTTLGNSLISQSTNPVNNIKFGSGGVAGFEVSLTNNTIRAFDLVNITDVGTLNFLAGSGITTSASQTYNFIFGANNSSTGSSCTIIGKDNVLTSGSNGIALGLTHTVSGLNAVAIGSGCTASGSGAMAFGASTASNTFSVAFADCTSSGVAAYAMGKSVTASGDNSSAHGFSTVAAGFKSFVIGDSSLSTAGGISSFTGGTLSEGTALNGFAFGNVAKAQGAQSVAFGDTTIASAASSFASGHTTTASGASSFAAGSNTIASATDSFAAGTTTTASGSASVAMGRTTTAAGVNSFAMGVDSTTSNDYGVAIGNTAVSSSTVAIAIGDQVTASGASSFASGKLTTASGAMAAAMNNTTIASGISSFASGQNTESTAEASTAMGYLTDATGDHSTALGDNTLASGPNSTATGEATVASGEDSFAAGKGTIADQVQQFSIGRYNVAGNTDSLFDIGVGTTDGSRALGLEFTNSVASGSKLNVAGSFQASAEIFDSAGNAGTSGQILSSTGTTTSWIDASGGTSYLPLGGGTMTGPLIMGDNVQFQLGTGNDMRIYHDPAPADGGENLFINTAGTLIFRQGTDNGSMIFESDNGAGATIEYFRLDGSLAVENGLHYTKFPDLSAITFGNGEDLSIYHDGSNSYIKEIGTGNLIISGANEISLKSDTDERMLQANAEGSVQLFHNNVEKLNTTSSGVSISGSINVNGQLNLTALNTAPANLTDTGTIGEIRYTSDNIYVCTQTGVAGSAIWVRVGLSGSGGGTVTSLTTTGTSGVSSFSNGILNIPNYTLGLDGTRVIQGQIMSSQILNMFTNPVPIISAPGANKIIVVDSVGVHYNFVTSDYSNNIFPSFKYRNSTSGVLGNSVSGTLTMGLVDNWNYYKDVSNSPIVNGQIVLSSNAQNPSGGDSTLFYNIKYRILNSADMTVDLT